MNWLERMKQKPKAYRERLAFGVSVGFTALVALVWFVSFGVTAPERLQEVSQGMNSDSEGSISGMFSNIGEQVATVRESIDQFQEDTDTLVGVATTTTAGSLQEQIDQSSTNVRGAYTTSTQPRSTTTTAKSSTTQAVPTSPTPTVPRTVLIATSTSAQQTAQ